MSIALALLVAGGSVTAWLLTRTPPDTDPNAPFEDLSNSASIGIMRKFILVPMGRIPHESSKRPPQSGRP